MSAVTNSDLVALQKQLITLVDDLSTKQEKADDANAIVAIGREIAEVNHRVTMVGQILFKEKTAKLTSAVATVQKGKKAVDDAIKSIEKLNAFVKTITRFLGLVDKAIDIAKLVA
jgi:hypothetical protein